ncbi:DinB family protein [Gracilimonas sp.]|uniref:DinB family protein n=1 Tax=Gracilimonas sp. TaxID=1974203 RepID=UPI0032EB0951
MQKALLIQFDLHQQLFNNVLKGFSDAETNSRLDGYPKMNHVKYLAGHLLNSQYALAQIAGVNPEVKWNELFAVMGQSAAKDNFEYPDIEEIKSEWNALYELTRKGLAKLDKNDLAKVPEEPFSQVAETVLDLWAFVNHHIGYHIGQISIMRRGFNKAPMSYE